MVDSGDTAVLVATLYGSGVGVTAGGYGEGTAVSKTCEMAVGGGGRGVGVGVGRQAATAVVINKKRSRGAEEQGGTDPLRSSASLPLCFLSRSANGDQLAGEGGQAAVARFGDEDIVFNAHAALARDINARFYREQVAGA